MSETIEIEIGDVYATLHNDLDAVLGDRYTQALRDEVEDWIHERNKEVERSREQALASAVGPGELDEGVSGTDSGTDDSE